MTIFSILLPFTDDLTALRTTLSSLTAQTHADWECICINSEDAAISALWLMAQSESDPRIMPSTNPGIGSIAALRYGFEMTNGKPVLICAPGEELAPDVLHRLCSDAVSPKGAKPPLMITQAAMRLGMAATCTPQLPDPMSEDLHSVRTCLARLGLPVHRYGWLRLLPKTMTNAENASQKTTLLKGAIGRVKQAVLPVASFFSRAVAAITQRPQASVHSQEHTRGVYPKASPKSQITQKKKLKTTQRTARRMVPQYKIHTNAARRPAPNLSRIVKHQER